jgi:hypothetical protein
MTETRSVAAADRMLPLLRRIVINVRARHRLMAKKTERLRDASPSEKPRVKAVVDRLRAELADYAAELKKLDVELLDAAAGLVGRKTLRGDREVTVTWRPGRRGFDEWFGEGESVSDRRPWDEEPAEASSAAFDV